MAIRNYISTNRLPAETRHHLHNLVVNNYTNGAFSENFTQNPDGIAGSTTKFGSAAGLAPGADSLRLGRGTNPGRFRLIRHIHHAPHNTVWIYAEHMGRSSYNFDKIEFPACEGCRGTTEIICPQCQGSNIRKTGTAHPHPLASHRVLPNLQSCNICRGRRVINCTICKPQGGPPPLVIGGKSISRIYAKW